MKGVSRLPARAAMAAIRLYQLGERGNVRQADEAETEAVRGQGCQVDQVQAWPGEELPEHQKSDKAKSILDKHPDSESRLESRSDSSRD